MLKITALGSHGDRKTNASQLYALHKLVGYNASQTALVAPAVCSALSAHCLVLRPQPPLEVGNSDYGQPTGRRVLQQERSSPGTRIQIRLGRFYTSCLSGKSGRRRQGEPSRVERGRARTLVSALSGGPTSVTKEAACGHRAGAGGAALPRAGGLQGPRPRGPAAVSLAPSPLPPANRSKVTRSQVSEGDRKRHCSRTEEQVH